jgi:hypothetical protein
MNTQNESYQLLEEYSKKLRILNNILNDIIQDGILSPALTSELAENEFIDVIEAINEGMPKQQCIEILVNKIKDITKKIQEIVR